MSSVIALLIFLRFRSSEQNISHAQNIIRRSTYIILTNVQLDRNTNKRTGWGEQTFRINFFSSSGVQVKEGSKRWRPSYWAFSYTLAQYSAASESSKIWFRVPWNPSELLVSDSWLKKPFPIVLTNSENDGGLIIRLIHQPRYSGESFSIFEYGHSVHECQVLIYRFTIRAPRYIPHMIATIGQGLYHTAKRH